MYVDVLLTDVNIPQLEKEYSAFLSVNYSLNCSSLSVSINTNGRVR